jgi:hypothetical protein
MRLSNRLRARCSELQELHQLRQLHELRQLHQSLRRGSVTWRGPSVIEKQFEPAVWFRFSAPLSSIPAPLAAVDGATQAPPPARVHRVVAAPSHDGCPPSRHLPASSLPLRARCKRQKNDKTSRAQDAMALFVSALWSAAMQCMPVA